MEKDEMGFWSALLKIGNTKKFLFRTPDDLAKIAETLSYDDKIVMPASHLEKCGLRIGSDEFETFLPKNRLRYQENDSVWIMRERRAKELSK